MSYRNSNGNRNDLQGNGMQEENTSASSSGNPTPPVDASRRRFTAAGVAATGMMATLASRPVLGAATCTAGVSPSAWCSGNASAGHLATGKFGRIPSYWDSNPADWPSSVTPNTPYKSIFASYPNGTLKFSDALTTGTGLQKATACAYLNALKGLTPYLTTADVVLMASGSYSPFAGTTWNSDTIVSYLNATFA